MTFDFKTATCLLWEASMPLCDTSLANAGVTLQYTALGRLMTWALPQTHDDSARFLSFTWTAIKTIDKAEAVAKTILSNGDCRKRDSIWSWLK